VVRLDKKAKKELLLVLALWFCLFLVPAFFMRIIDDEAIYFYTVRELAFSGTAVGRAPLGHLLMSPFVQMNNDILSLRLFNAIVTLGILVLLNTLGGIRAVLLFSSTFSSLRWSTRVNFEILGTFWFLLAIYHMKKDERLSALFLILAALTRETFLIPLLVFCLLKPRAARYVLVGGVIAFLTIQVLTMPDTPIWTAMLLYGRVIFSQGIVSPDFLLRTSQNILEYGLTAPFLFIGLIRGKRNDNDEKLLAVSLLVATLFVPGFIINGPFERYTIPTTAAFSYIGAAGVGMSNAHLLPVLFLQATFLDRAVPFLSNTDANGVFDTGLEYDRMIMEKLGAAKRDDYIVGFHGALVRRVGWDWVGRDVDLMIERRPNWLVVYRKWVVIREDRDVAVFEIGRYYVLHSESSDALSAAISPLNKTLWGPKEEWMA